MVLISTTMKFILVIVFAALTEFTIRQVKTTFAIAYLTR